MKPIKQTPRLSASIAHKLLQAPLLGWSSHRLLGNHREKKKESGVEGRLWHASILEDGKGVEVLDFDAFRSTEAKTARDKALREGLIPITSLKWKLMERPLVRIHEELRAAGVNLDGEFEERIEWSEEADDGTIVPCSGYTDHRNGLAIDDLKTGPGATTTRLANNLIMNSHSLLQDAAYRSAVAKIHGADRERVYMRFVFVQTQEPFIITPVDLSGEYQEVSYLRWRRAINTWAACAAKGWEREHWPGTVPPGTTETIHPPGWAMAQELELEALGK